MTAIDDRTIQITLSEGFSAASLARSLRSPALRLSSEIGSSIDGSGPYVMSIPSRDRKLLTTALTHRAGRAFLNEVSVISYLSAEESVLDFGRGSLDALIITSNERDSYYGSSRAVPERIETIGQGLIVLIFNPARITDLNERSALAMAMDSESIANLVLGSGAVVASDFQGNPVETAGNMSIEQARELYETVANPTPELSLLVCDDPAAKSAAGRLRANWESLGVPVNVSEMAGPLSLSSEADAILISLRIPMGGEGVLPECLTLCDRSGWWDLAGLALPSGDRALLQSVRACEPEADLNSLGAALINSALMIPVARFDILFAPGPDISLAPNAVYPGTVLWRAFMGSPEILSGEYPEG
jgi:ABC-type transport system substrate-binding protein